jgi:type II secretory pathway pseudopilin PulG
MHVMSFAAVALVTTLVIATATATEAGAANNAHVTCTLQMQTLALPGASGEDFGTVNCASVFGKGVQHDTLTVTPTSQTTAKVTGPFKQFFDAGTIHGTVNLTASATSAGAVTYKGAAEISGGTGAYKHVKGSAKVQCTSPDGGTHTTCTEKATPTHI